MSTSRIAGVFDPDPARRLPYHGLLREFATVAARPPPMPPDTGLPNGRGQPVLVIPGFCTVDHLTRRMRADLARCGFEPFGWRLGMNFGPTDRALDGLNRRVDEIVAKHGPVVLVGISLGGLMARNLAYDRPDDIRHVITVASPFVLPTASSLEPLVRLCAWRFSKAVSMQRLATPLPVPSTMLYTADDGIVAPDSCWRTLESGEVVPLTGSHLAMASHPDTILAIVRCIAALTPALDPALDPAGAVE